MHTSTRRTARHLESLATDIERCGFAPFEPAVATIVERAREAHLDPVVVRVLADRCAPAIARARAFGIVAGGLTASDDRRGAADTAAMAP